MSATVAASSVATGNAGTVAVTKPSGSASGDMLVAFHAVDFGLASAMTAPSGWTLLGTDDPSSGGSGSAIRIKVWQADGAVASTTFSNNTGADAVVVIARITGHDSAATPIVGTAGSTTAISTSFNAPSVTPAGSDDLLLCCGGAEASAGSASTITWTEPAGMTHVNNGQSTTWTSIDVASLALSSSSATGTKAFTPSSGATSWIWAAVSVAVKSAATGGGGSSTVTKTFAFATTAEGFAANPSPPTGTTHTYDAATGNPAGSLKTRTTGRNRTKTTSWWDFAGTWEDLGVPAGGTVTAIQLTGASTRCTEYTTGASSNIGPYELRDSAGTTVVGTLWAGRTITGTDASWVATTSQAAVSVPSGYQASNTSIRLRLADQQATGANNSAAISTYDDQVALSITYTPAPAGASASAAGSVTLSGTGTAAAAGSSTGSVALVGTGTAAAIAAAPGSVTLTGTGVARATATGAGSIELAGTGTAGSAATATATGSITLSGTATGTGTGGGAPVTFTSLTTGSDTTNGTTYTTASITPTAGKLYLCAVAVAVGSAPTPTVTVTGCGLPWEEAVTSDITASRATHIFVAKGTPTSGALTITGASTLSVCAWNVTEVGGVDLTGATATAALAQTFSDQTSTTTSLNDPLPTAVTAGNATFAAVQIPVQELPSAGTGWTSMGTASQSAPTTGFIAESAVTGQQNITASWTTTGIPRLAAIEIKAAGGGSIGTAATASGSVTLGGTATAAAAATASGSLTLGGSGTAAARPAATGAVTLAGTGAGVGSASAAGSLTLSGTATAGTATPASAAGSITLGGTGSPSAPVAAAGTVTLAGTGAASASTSSSGSVTLAGTSAARATPAATGTLTLGGTGTARGSATSAGSVTLGGTGTARVSASATGGITLSGTGTGVPAGTQSAAGTITLAGTATARASAAATGSVTLGGTATARAAVAASGSVTLGGTSSGTAKVAATGSLTLAAAADLSALANAEGALVLDGLATGTIPGALIGDAAPEHTLRVPAENRTTVVGAEDRTLTVGPDTSRVLTVAAADRTQPVAADRRLITA